MAEQSEGLPSELFPKRPQLFGIWNSESVIFGSGLAGLGLSRGLAAFNLKHQFNANRSYEFPFRRSQHWGSRASGFADKLIGGWQWNGIFTA